LAKAIGRIDGADANVIADLLAVRRSISGTVESDQARTVAPRRVEPRRKLE
jgi:hypothetical protein